MKRFVVAAITSLFLFQCSSEEGPESFIEVSIVPPQPVAINAPITENPGTDAEIAHQPAVLSFSMRVKNDGDSDYHLVIAAISATFTNVVSGAETIIAFDAASYDVDFIASVAPGGDSVVVNGDGDIIRFFAGGLPSDTLNSFRYRASVKLLGWFTKISDCGGDSSCDTTELYLNQSSRLNKTITFTSL